MQNINNLIPVIKTKQGTETPCKFCSKKIEPKSKYLSIIYSDGFTKRGFGAFHFNCWDEYKNNLLIKTPRK